MGEAVVPSDSEFDPGTHLMQSDIKPQWVEVRIKASKTDPFRDGVTLYLGATGKWLCPVAAVLSYLVQRGKREGPLFVFTVRGVAEFPRAQSV